MCFFINTINNPMMGLKATSFKVLIGVNDIFEACATVMIRVFGISMDNKLTGPKIPLF